MPEGVFCGDLVLDGKKIVQVGGTYEACPDDSVIDVTGKYVFPGFIDAHTHMQCWTGMDWTADSFETGTRAAACGGTTTIVDYATQDKGMTLPEALDEWHKRVRLEGLCTSPCAVKELVEEFHLNPQHNMCGASTRHVRRLRTYRAKA